VREREILGEVKERILKGLHPTKASCNIEMNLSLSLCSHCQRNCLLLWDYWLIMSKRCKRKY